MIVMRKWPWVRWIYATGIALAIYALTRVFC
jgi:hypothetical protein